MDKGDLTSVMASLTNAGFAPTLTGKPTTEKEICVAEALPTALPETVDQRRYAPVEADTSPASGAGFGSTPTPAFVAPAPVTPETVAEPTPVAEVSAQGEELDVKGFPWDERIHAGTQTKMKNGEWKKKRGVEEILVRQVEAELGGTVVPASAPVDITPVPAAPSAHVVPAAPSAPVVPAAPSAGKSYSQLVELIKDKMAVNMEIGAGIQEAVAKQGLNGVPDLQTQEPEVIASVFADIEAL
tara:strand:+ start:13065 stop:13790 length:726 start_codon:yes stop_codon:yes gene_type:complete